MDIEGACQATQAHSLLIGSKDDLRLLFFSPLALTQALGMLHNLCSNIVVVSIDLCHS